MMRVRAGTLEGGHMAKGVLAEQDGSEPPAKRPRREGS